MAFKDLYGRALSGSTAAQTELGLFYMQESHLTGQREYTIEAVKWLWRAARRGSQEAQRNLHLFLEPAHERKAG